MQTLQTRDVCVGPVEGVFNSIEFGTKVFKRKEEYPVGRLMLQKLPEWMRVVAAYVRERKV